ncbi:hypothetical protein, partial [Streptomyces sp. PAL114]|uniref:hypothetical protein n=1 Tax=Streptomyces sp. PAL114 TaxID=2970893 RepID=UPI0039673F52
MSVHSHPAARQDLAAAPEFPRHVVTAVLVSHDGARWLPDALAGLLGQELAAALAVVRARAAAAAALPSGAPAVRDAWS